MQTNILKGPQFENVVDQHSVLSTFTSSGHEKYILD